jgi:hypothetical protein
VKTLGKFPERVGEEIRDGVKRKKTLGESGKVVVATLHYHEFQPSDQKLRLLLYQADFCFPRIDQTPTARFLTVGSIAVIADAMMKQRFPFVTPTSDT